MSARTAPAPGQAPLPAPNAAALLRRNGTDDATAARAAIHFEDRTWTHAEFFAESVRWANLFLAHGPSTPDGVLHVGVLLDNTPEYLFALGGAALSGAVVVGLNHTRRDEHLLSRHRAHARRADRHRVTTSRAAPAVRVEASTRARSRMNSRTALAGASERRPRPRAGRRLPLGVDLHVGDVVGTEGGDLHAAPPSADRRAHGGDHGPRA